LVALAKQWLVLTNRKGKQMTVTIEEIENYQTILLGEGGKAEQLLEQRKRLTDAIYEYISTDSEPDSDHIAEVTAAMHKDIQLRDFVLGLPSEAPIERVNAYLAYFMHSVPAKFIAPIASILAANLYSVEDKEAKNVLSLALIHEPRYSLAQLLNRVFNSDWPAGAFKTMTEELHPKVKAGMGI
jgi:hypothetical protein